MIEKRKLLVHNFQKAGILFIQKTPGTNVFNFEGKTHQQATGTAMGTPMAPTAANLPMGPPESRTPETSPAPANVTRWKRLIDDTSALRCGSEEELRQFTNFLNSVTDPR